MKTRVSEDQLHRMIIDNLPVGVVRLDSEGRIEEWNPAAEKITGWTAAELLGRAHGDIFHPQDPGSCPLARKESALDVETTLRRDGSTEKVVLLSACPLFDADGDYIGGVEMFRDVTDARRAERERAETLSHLAHDLKTPVVVIGGFLSRIEAGKAGPVTDQQKSDLRLLIEELARMEPMIDRLSAYARSILGTKKIRP